MRAPWNIVAIPARPLLPVNLTPPNAAPAYIAYTSPAYNLAPASEYTVSVTIAGDNTVAGTLSISQSATSPLTLSERTSEFTPASNTFSAVGTLNVSGNGTVTSGVFQCSTTSVQLQWTPTAGSAGTIVATIVPRDGS